MELLEREHHLAQLEEHRRLAAAGQGRLVLVGGEAGVGKTSLIEEFCRRLPGPSALRISCDALSTPSPLGSARELAPMLGLHVDHFPADRPERDQLFHAVLAAFAARTEPTVAIGEDAHWADGVSLEFIRFLARRIADLPVLIIVTYRDDEIGLSHPLRLLLGDLATSPTVHRLGVSPLTETAVGRLAVPAGRDATQLYRLTGGNPFFLSEVLAAEGGAVPDSVGDAILSRAARLSPEARAVLDVAAVIGSSIDLDLLLAVAGQVLDETDEAIARGLLQAREDGLAFRHELAREAILSTISPPRRRLLHARVLGALRDRPADEHDLALLAHHAEAAGDRAAVLEYAIPAATQAAALHAHREAAAQYARALRFADRLPAAERARLYEGRSIACYLSDQGDEAVAARLAALELWRGLGDPLREGDNLRWLSRLSWFAGRGAEAEAAATAALELLEPLSSGPELAMAYSNLAQLRMLADDVDETLHWGNRAIALAEQLGETETLLHALANVGTTRLDSEVAKGEQDLRRSLSLALDHGFVDHAGRVLTNLAWSALRVMRLDESERRLATAIAYTTEHDLDNYRWYLLATRATIGILRGRWDEAEAELHHVLRQPVQSPLTRIVALAALGRLAARRGEADAAALLDEALLLAERTEQLMRLEPVRAARAEAALLGGDLPRARTEAEAVRGLTFSRGTAWQRGEIACLLWRAGDRGVPRDRLAAPYALQLAGDCTGAAAAWRELGCPYEEACALAESNDSRLVRQAVIAFDALGAKPALAQAIRRLRSFGVQDLPSLRLRPGEAPRASPLALTAREMEVLRLLIAGNSNREIGEALFISPATAARHVANLYNKLGVDSRAEATAYALQHGLA